MINTLAIIVIAFITSCIVCGLLLRITVINFLDVPDARSLHAVPVPRSGGIGIWLGFALAYFVWHQSAGLDNTLSASIICAGIILLVVSLLDDIKAQPPLVRLLVQLLAAGLLLFSGQFEMPQIARLLPVWVESCALVFVFLWSINLYNFMDGMDGFAAGMACFGFGVIAILAWLAGDTSFALLNGILVSSVAGFWVWNFPPARIFMGDAGSVLLGFFAVMISIAGIRKEVLDWQQPLILFAPFWLDATVTLAKRVYRLEKIWLPHRSHYYQRLALSGLGHRRTVLWEYLLMGLSGASVLLDGMSGRQYAYWVAAFWVLFYAILIVWLERYLAKSGSAE